MQVPMTENQLGEMQMMKEVAEHAEMNYHDTPDSFIIISFFVLN